MRPLCEEDLAMSDANTSVDGRKLIVLGQIPPPYHGQAIGIQQMVNGLRDQLDLVHIPMQFSDTVYDNGRMKLRKVTHLLSLIIRTLRILMRHPGSVLYYPPAPASWVPVIRDLLILSFVRPFASKTIFHFHAHGLGEFLKKRAWLLNFTWAWKHPDHAIVMGESCVGDAELFSPAEISIVPLGIELAAAKRKRTTPKTIRVLYVGMLAEPKGLFDVLETASLLADLNVEFRLAGTYKYTGTRERFEQRRRALGLEDTVHAIGQRTGDDLWQEYADADLFFFPTHFETETFGLVTLEAMAHALPVVASNWRGPRDIVRDGKTGILCETQNPLSYANAIRRLALDSDLRLAMGHAGKTLCESQYQLRNYVESLGNLFRHNGCRTK